jgi:uncharacterized membrane protein
MSDITTTETLLQRLRRKVHEHRAAGPDADEKNRTFGEKAADVVAGAMGSWRFVLIQSAILIVWIIWNAGAHPDRFDPYPFILLNLALSFQAAYAAPMILMSQNRQSDIDRSRAIQDFDINCKAELEIETLHQKIDLLKEQEIADLTRAVARLAEAVEAQTRKGGHE